MESLHEELFEKVRSLSGDEGLVNRLAARMKGESTVDRIEFTQNSPEAETSPKSLETGPDGVQAVHSNGRMRDDRECSPAGAEPDDGGAFTKDNGRRQTGVESVKTPSSGKVSASQIRDAHEADGHASPVAYPIEFAADPASTGSVILSEPAVASSTTTSTAPPDYEAHYTLGVAYKNMGLYEEAKEEFRVSMNSDSFYLDSALITAVCLKEERHITEAIQQLEIVMADSRCQGAKAQAIRYELGLLYEAEEQWEKAAHAFESIPSFHDVPQRLAALRGRQVGGEAGFRYAS
jgi:tetratricopeptide (TPR) repeat protein